MTERLIGHGHRTVPRYWNDGAAAVSGRRADENANDLWSVLVFEPWLAKECSQGHERGQGLGPG